MMKELITTIQINASPTKVWAILASGPDWGAWNPFILRVEGELREGARLSNSLAMPGRKPMGFKPVVLKAEPGTELRWLGRVLLPGLFDGEHYFKLEAEGGGTHFVHGERFSGILSGMLNMDEAKAGFEAFNAGLKKKAESPI
jgi:hypothetical protein